MRSSKDSIPWEVFAIVLVVLLDTTCSSLLRSNNRRLSDTNDGEGDIVVFLDIDGVLAPYREHGEETGGELAPKGLEEDKSLSDRIEWWDGLWGEDEEAHPPGGGGGEEEGDEEEHPTRPYKDVCHRVVPDRTLAVFSNLLQDIPPNRRTIVLSSAWRNRWECEQLALEYLHVYGHKHKNSSLNDIDQFNDRTGPKHDSRQQEIMEWLVCNDNIRKHIAAWIVLDDRPSVIEEEPYHEVFQGHAIITKKHVGLTQEDAEKALQLLNQQMGRNHTKPNNTPQHLHEEVTNTTETTVD